MELIALSRSFFNRSPVEVAPELLGQLLVRKIEGKTLVGKIVEVEAYLAAGDEAAHGHRGMRPHTASLFKEAGHAYVHTMRHYALLDVVTEGPDTPSSVLIRGVEQVRGPGRVGKAFCIDKTLDGTDMTDASGPLFIAQGTDTREVRVSPRIGISKAKDMPLRFYYD